MVLYVGQKLRLHELAHHLPQFTGSFKTENGRVQYEGIDYPNRASGWWAIVSRYNDKMEIVTRRIHTDTVVEITEIRE